MPDANYDFLCARLRGVRASLYERDRLSRLCDCTSLEQLLRQLYPGRQIGDHIALERALTESHVSQLARVAKHLAGAERKLFAWLLCHYQLEALKVIFRCWANHEPMDVLTRYLPELPRKLALPVELLMQANSLGGFAAAVPVPVLRRALQRLQGQDQRPEDLYPVQATLDHAYYAELRTILRRVPERHRLPAQRMVRLDVAIYDILVLARGRLNYSLSFDELVAPVVAAGELLAGSRARRLGQAGDLAQLLDALPRALRRAGAAAQDVQNLEHALWTRLYDVANHSFYTRLFDLGTVAAFYYIKRVELANLIRVVESVRAGLPPDRIRTQLIPSLA